MPDMSDLTAFTARTKRKAAPPYVGGSFFFPFFFLTFFFQLILEHRDDCGKHVTLDFHRRGGRIMLAPAVVLEHRAHKGKGSRPRRVARKNVHMPVPGVLVEEVAEHRVVDVVGLPSDAVQRRLVLPGDVLQLNKLAAPQPRKPLHVSLARQPCDRAAQVPLLFVEQQRPVAVPFEDVRPVLLGDGYLSYFHYISPLYKDLSCGGLYTGAPPPSSGGANTRLRCTGGGIYFMYDLALYCGRVPALLGGVCVF